VTAISRKIQWSVWGGLLLIIVTIAVLYVLARMDSKPTSLPVYGQVMEFTLTNQTGRVVSRDTLRGELWLADIIFTRCPGPCAQMTKRMAELQYSLRAAGSLKLVSLTSDPEYDTADVLEKYAGKYGAQPDRWWFLTGPKAEITRLAIDGLKLTVVDKKPEERIGENDLFIHSTISVLVDKKGRLRGVFELLEPGTHEQIVKAVEQLAKETN
jgi:protein SCO1/2